MIFSCLPPDSKCEWADLKRFVVQYNDTQDAAYQRAACLDVEKRGMKMPELLLEAHGERPVVIERKSVAWPREEYFADHRHEHELASLVVDRIHTDNDSFAYSSFQLTLYTYALQGKKKRDIHDFASQIANHILSHQDAAKSLRGISSQQPIPWHFSRARFDDEEESAPTVGCRITIRDDEPDLEASLEEFRRRVAAARQGYAAEFVRCAEAAAEKFAEFAHCRRLFLVQFFGSVTNRVRDDDLVKIIRTAQIPDAIDEVWLADADWVSADDYEIVWKHVR